MTTQILITDDERRLDLASRIKALDDVVMPRLQYWNYDACEHHRATGPKVDCEYRACGGDLFSHQRVGTAWLYAVCKGLLADDPGVGKTSQILALLALLKERNELRRRAIIIPNTPAVGQWGKEISRWTPGIRQLVIDSSLDQRQRIAKYATSWDVLVIGQHLLISDIDELEKLVPFSLVVTDDVDPLLNHNNATHRAIMRAAAGATRSFTVNATTLQIKLQQLHAAFSPAGGLDIFGTLPKFENRYVRTELVTLFDDKGKRQRSRQATGYKNIDELKEKIGSVYLRRKATELSDIRMPMLMPPQIEWLEMSGPQKERYQELQQGVIRLIRDEGVSVKRANALAKFTYGQQICAGLPALGEPDGPGASPKLDLLFHRLNGVWADRKTIVFVKNVGMVKAAIRRAEDSGFGCALIWGNKQNPKQREEQKEKFWDDPNCRFLIGTTALERSHNLQCANTVVALDSHLNPARMAQILGRGRRAGSPHDRVFMYSYMMMETQEEGYTDVLRERQAIADTVFGDQSEIYEALPPLRLLQLMTP